MRTEPSQHYDTFPADFKSGTAFLSSKRDLNVAMKRLLGMGEPAQVPAAQVPLEEAVASANAEKLAQLVQEP